MLCFRPTAVTAWHDEFRGDAGPAARWLRTSMKTQFIVDVYEGDRRVDSLAVDRTGLSIGRNPSNGIVLKDRAVSKRHARLVPGDTGLMLTDLESTSGTFVRGSRVTVTTLLPGESFRIGPYELRVSDPAASGGSAQESLERAVTDLRSLLTLVGITDMQAVLDTLLERTMQVFGASRGYVVLSRGTGLSPILARYGTAADRAEAFSRTVCEEALAKRQPVLLSATPARTISGIESLMERSPELVLAIPLVDGTDVLGVLYLETDQAVDPATGADARLSLGELSTVGGRALRGALERHQLHRDNVRWRWLAQLSTAEPDLLKSTRSKKMRQTVEIVQRLGLEDVTALILGESGTGKEVTARSIHRASARRNGPFVAINCGAIPRDLIEAELFGHEKGAFTGAVARKLGRLELAEDGTLFLDEVGEMPRDLQVKLLRALETRELERLGGAELIRWNARVLAATNADLSNSVASGEFRSDLYYRLNVVSLQLPSLRERREDIEPLVHELLMLANQRFRRKLYGVSQDALQALEAYDWPGNIRELKNVIERAFILEKSDRITASCLPFTPPPPVETASIRGTSSNDGELVPLETYLGNHEQAYIQRVLERVEGNVTKAAQILGIARSALHRKLRLFGIRGSTAPQPDDVED